MKKLGIVCISIAMPILIIGIVGVILFFDYKKTELEGQKEKIHLCFKKNEQYLNAMLETECKNKYSSVKEQIINGTYGYCIYEKEKLVEYIEKYTRWTKECIN